MTAAAAPVAGKAAADAAPPGQSLARGAAGTALLPIEHALAGTGTWHDAHAAITRAAAAPIDAGTHASLLYGAPALAFTLHATCADGHPRYEKALTTLTRHVERITRQRLIAARARLRTATPGTFSEYDLFHRLTGLGVILLRTAPGSDALQAILRHLTALTRPVTVGGHTLPGWWTAGGPGHEKMPGGHGNNGVAHGIAGVLAALSIAARMSIWIDGQGTAIEVFASWLEKWGASWWITLPQLSASVPQPPPLRPSWCYGTPGIARALQLAALATGNTTRQAEAEHAIAASLTPERLATLTDPGLCHGLAGTYQTAARAARDALTPEIGNRLPALANALRARAAVSDTRPGLLTGSTGTRLALETARNGTPRSGWDSCLLLA